MNDLLVRLLLSRIGGINDLRAAQALDMVVGFVRDNPERLQRLLDSEQGARVIDKLEELLPGSTSRIVGGLMKR